MHMITSGLSGQQRGLWLKQTKLEEDDPEVRFGSSADGGRPLATATRRTATPDPAYLPCSCPQREAWVLESSPASLAACSKLWLGKEMDKTGRDLFVKGSMMDIQNNFQVPPPTPFAALGSAVWLTTLEASARMKRPPSRRRSPGCLPCAVRS